MAQHYYNKSGTHYLEQKRLAVGLSPFSEVHLNFMSAYLGTYAFSTPEEKKEVLKRFSVFASGIKKYFKTKDMAAQVGSLLCSLAQVSEEDKKKYFSNNGFAYHTSIKNENGIEISAVGYDSYANTQKCEYLDLKVLNLKPSTQLSDSSKSTKINWSEHKKQAAFLKSAADFIQEFQLLTKNSSYQMNFTLSLELTHARSLFRASTLQDTQNLPPPLKLQVSIQAVAKQLQNFWQSVEKKVIPVMEKTYALEEKDFLYKEFQGSLDNPVDLIESKAYYFMGRYDGKEGFIGLTPPSNSYYGNSGPMYKIVKEIKNAHLFTSDKSAELSHFAPLTKIHMNVQLSHIENASTPAAAQVEAYIEKHKLNCALPQAVEAQNIHDKKVAARHKI